MNTQRLLFSAGDVSVVLLNYRKCSRYLDVLLFSCCFCFSILPEQRDSVLLFVEVI